MSARDVAVVIPTRDRRASVIRALVALSKQSYPAASTEVIVVADGCSDATAVELAARKWPFDLRVLEQPASGAAVARNRGAAAGQAGILIFLDDDIEVSREFVAAHVAHHAVPDVVAIGYLPPDLQGRRDFFTVMLRAWWEAMFERMREGGHRFVYSDLLSGNFSLSRSLFERVGGFDETLRCHEDYELGYRLIQAGARLRFAHDAMGWHHEQTDLGRALTRKREEGRADVALATRHPELLVTLPLARRVGRLTRRSGLLMHLALTRPAVGDRVARGYGAALDTLERLRLRKRWRRLLDDLLSYWYWRGVAEAGGGNLANAPHVPHASLESASCDVDLRQGLEAASRDLDAVRSDVIRLVWGPIVVAEIPPQPGAERLQGRHLKALLRGSVGNLAAAFARTATEPQEPSTAEAATLTGCPGDAPRREL
jgi:GT2 family glycosyltransferase